MSRERISSDKPDNRPPSKESDSTGGEAALPGSHLWDMVVAGTRNSHHMRTASRSGAMGLIRRRKNK